MTTLPLTLTSKFEDGVARFTSSVEARNAESTLRQAQVAYQTKIKKNKKTGVSYVITLLEPVHADTALRD